MVPKSYPRYVTGYMDFDDDGVCECLSLAGQTFTPVEGESEEALCERAMRETGKADHDLMLVHFVKSGPDGGLAPGFERFAK